MDVPSHSIGNVGKLQTVAETTPTPSLSSEQRQKSRELDELSQKIPEKVSFSSSNKESTTDGGGGRIEKIEPVQSVTFSASTKSHRTRGVDNKINTSSNDDISNDGAGSRGSKASKSSRSSRGSRGIKDSIIVSRQRLADIRKQRDQMKVTKDTTPTTNNNNNNSTRANSNQDKSNNSTNSRTSRPRPTTDISTGTILETSPAPDSEIGVTMHSIEEDFDPQHSATNESTMHSIEEDFQPQHRATNESTNSIEEDFHPQYSATNESKIEEGKLTSNLNPQQKSWRGLGNGNVSLKQTKTLEEQRATDSNVHMVIRLWLAFNFLIAPIRDGLNPFVSVYLVAVAGFSPGTAGLIWAIRDAAVTIFHVPFGFFFDYTSKKKSFLFLCTTVCAIVPISIIWTTNLPILVIKTVLEGVGSSGLAVSKGPFTLGITGHEMFGAISKDTEVAEHAGSFFAALGAGCVAYILYPDVALLFYVIAAFGCLACVCILLMPTYSTPNEDGDTFIIVDDGLARNSNKADVKKRKIKNAAKDNENTSVDEFHDDPPTKVKTSFPRNLFKTTVKKQKIKNAAEDNENTSVDEFHDDPIKVKTSFPRNLFKTTVKKQKIKNAAKDNEKTIDADVHDESNPTEGPISMWKTISTDTNLLLFALAIFFFHLGNAAVLPLLSQAIAVNKGRAGIPYTAANIVTAQISSVGAAYMMDYFVAKGVRINIPILIGFGSQALRIGIILVLSYYWPNDYALVATQLLDGLGAGVNGLAIVQITKLLTTGTNGFGAVISFVNLCNFCGGLLSNLISGFIVAATSYETGFICLLCPIVLSLLLINLLQVPTDYNKCAEEEDDISDTDIELSDEQIMSELKKSFSGFQMAGHSSNINARRFSMPTGSMPMGSFRRSVHLPQDQRRLSMGRSMISSKQLGSDFGVSPEIKLRQSTKQGRRLSSIVMKYD